MSYMSFQMAQQMKAQKLASDSRQQKVTVHKGDVKTAPSRAGFSNDKKADSGTFESTSSESVADSGGSWGAQTPDSGVVENNPEPSYNSGGYEEPAEQQPQEEQYGEEEY